MTKHKIEFDHKCRATYERIARRFFARNAFAGLPPCSELDVEMVLAAANGMNGNPELNLDSLLNAKLEDMNHDIFGLLDNLNRTTGKIENCFVPRHAKRVTEKSIS